MKGGPILNKIGPLLFHQRWSASGRLWLTAIEPGTSRIAADGRPRFELGATGHGPRGADLAGRVVAGIHRWDHDRTAQPTITGYPADRATQSANGVIIVKKNIQMIVAPSSRCMVTRKRILLVWSG